MTVLGGDDTMSPESELSRDISGKLNVFFTDSDNENEFSNEGNLVEEKKLEEIMQELYKEITNNTSTPPPTLTFRSPSSSPLAVSSSQPFFSVRCDVKSESCGASMSDSSSTMMAGIEFVGSAGKLPDVKKAGLQEAGKGYSTEEVWAIGGGEDEEMKGCDEEEAGEVDDDQWLARVLRWVPLELEEGT